MKKIAFVIPWFGENIPGGAEFACKSIAVQLKQKGLDVEILTTCIKEFSSSWSKNHYTEGIDLVNDIPVRRFKVRKRDTRRFDQINYNLMNNIEISLQEEKKFFREMINCPSLYRYIQDNKDQYSCYIFIPYMFSTTYYGVKACPEKSIIIPCLHNESYAYMESIKEIFKQCKGIIFLSEPEKLLSEKLYNINSIKREVIGTSIKLDISHDHRRFITKYNVKNPFILYAGRKDAGKSVDTLIKYYQRFKENNKDIKLDLVLIGGGSINIPLSIRNNVFDLGFISVQDKYDAYAAASLLCQPSLCESFSIVIMESWICGTPILVNNKCEVTKSFCKKTNGGLYFDSYEEFEGCIKYILNNKEIAQKMAMQGKRFVEQNFNCDTIAEKYIKFIQSL